MQSLLEKGYELVSGGTDNHLVLVNLRNKVKGNIPSLQEILLVLWPVDFASWISALTTFPILF